MSFGDVIGTLLGIALGLLVLWGVGYIGYMLGHRACGTALKECVSTTAALNNIAPPHWSPNAQADVTAAWKNIEDWFKRLFHQQ